MRNVIVEEWFDVVGEEEADLRGEGSSPVLHRFR